MFAELSAPANHGRIIITIIAIITTITTIIIIIIIIIIVVFLLLLLVINFRLFSQRSLTSSSGTSRPLCSVPGL
ncbi:hypothetical protein EYF80_041094 [Liparis tanakae]|uniref:Uncharacterized protein n=1 Tax=Liparis tanakae TaxID=230148 RepID=A0A4Z2G584_9TELE|nr:hypothetical protein EYF80_041094 [Liparis tanakae]